MNGGQLDVFFGALLLGAAIGALYDLFRIFRLAISCRPVTVALQDIVCFLAAAALTFLFFLEVNSGQLRGFVIAAELLGAAIYHFTLGRLVMRAAKQILRAVRAVLRLIFRIFLRPPLRLMIFAVRKLRRAAAALQQKGKVVRKSVNLHLKQRCALVYNKKGYMGAAQSAHLAEAPPTQHLSASGRRPGANGIGKQKERK